MKKLLTLFAVLAMFAFASCEESGGDDVNPNDKTEQPGEKPDDGSGDTEKPDDGSEIPDDAYISINKDILTFSPDGESVDIKVYSNYTWELTNNCDWVTTFITSGEASDEGVTVKLSAGLSYDNREGTIIFSCGKAKKPLVVSQSLKEVLFADENNTFNIPTEGGNAIIAYQTTVECEVVIPEEAQSWISIAPTETRALVSYSTTLNVAENTTYSARSAIVKVVAVGNNSLVAEYTITQDSNPFYIEYTSTDGEVVTPYWEIDEEGNSVFGAHIIHNEYIDGKGYISFDAPITSIGGAAFFGCSSLASITIPDSVTSIGEGAFFDCSSLASITIPDGVTSIGEIAFYNCSSLESITIPDSVTSLGDYAFSDCSSLKSIIIPNSVTEIGDWAFGGCDSLANVTIGDGVTAIGDWAFGGCDSLASITIPDSVTSIGESAFNSCSSLASVTIGNSVTSIGGAAFVDCSRLASVYCRPTIPPTGDNYMFDYNARLKIYVPTESVEAYKAAYGWSDYAYSIVGYDFE